MKELVYADYNRQLQGQQAVLSCMDCQYLEDCVDVPTAVGAHLYDHPTHQLMLLAQTTTVGMFRSGTSLIDTMGGTAEYADAPRPPMVMVDMGVTYLLWDLGFGGWRLKESHGYTNVIASAGRFTMAEAIHEILSCAAVGELHKSVAVIVAPEDAAKVTSRDGGQGGD